MSDLPRPDAKVLYRAHDGPSECVIVNDPPPRGLQAYMRSYESSVWSEGMGFQTAARALLDERAEFVEALQSAQRLIGLHEFGAPEDNADIDKIDAVLAKAEERTK